MVQIEPLSYSFVTVNTYGQVVSHRAGQAEQLAFDIGGEQPLAMISLRGGTFLMGSPAGEGYPDEKPWHEVRVEPFFIGRFPVTQGQWMDLMDLDKGWRFRGARKAVHNVSWREALEFCERLTKLTGHAFWLPSEAQWEYACRGGTETAFSCGPTITTDLANYNGEYTYLAAPKGPYRHLLLDVDAFPANPFGLHEMHGNLWEWCADPWHDRYDGAPADGRVWDEGGSDRYRVARGGSWHETPDLCRSAGRLKLPYDEGDEMIGLRVVINAGW
jgi:formylglycine-generating enzyme required for sulfatase activity